MRRTAFLLIATAVWAGGNAPARAEYFDTGNRLWETCQSRNMDLACVAASSAYFDMMFALGYGCTRSTVGVSRQQVRDVILQYLTENPAERHSPAAFLAIMAIQKAFNCSRK